MCRGGGGDGEIDHKAHRAREAGEDPERPDKEPCTHTQGVEAVDIVCGERITEHNQSCAGIALARPIFGRNKQDDTPGPLKDRLNKRVSDGEMERLNAGR